MAPLARGTESAFRAVDENRATRPAGANADALTAKAVRRPVVNFMVAGKEWYVLGCDQAQLMLIHTDARCCDAVGVSIDLMLSPADVIMVRVRQIL